MYDDLNRLLKLCGIEQINESVSKVVYHYTPFYNALKILKSNTLTGISGSISTTRSLHGAYHKSNKLIGVIFILDGNKLNTRYKSSPIGTEPQAIDTTENPFFKSVEEIDDWLDDDQINTMYAMIEKKYGPQWWLNNKIVDKHDNFLVKVPYSWIMQGKNNGQLEDRIHTKKIENFINYVKHALIYIPKEYYNDYENDYKKDEFGETYHSQLQHMKEVINVLKQKGIDYNVVTSEKELSYYR